MKIKVVHEVEEHKNVFRDFVSEACGDVALPQHTLARWVKAFREGRDAVQDNLRTGRPLVTNNTLQLLASLLDPDRR